MVIRRIHVLSLGRVVAAVGGAIGLVLGALVASAESVVLVLTALIPGASRPSGPHGLFTGLGAVVFVPVAFGVLGFVMGTLSAGVFNLISPKIGGLEIDVE